MVKTRTLYLNPNENGSYLKYSIILGKVWERHFKFLTTQLGENQTQEVTGLEGQQPKCWCMALDGWVVARGKGGLFPKNISLHRSDDWYAWLIYLS